jgi:hypothetical protein
MTDRIIIDLVSSIVKLSKRAVKEYTPIVDSILNSRSRDIKRIEHTLDGLLDSCGNDEAPSLFKKLCRYYYDIDPMAAFEDTRSTDVCGKMLIYSESLTFLDAKRICCNDFCFHEHLLNGI